MKGREKQNMRKNKADHKRHCRFGGYEIAVPVNRTQATTVIRIYPNASKETRDSASKVFSTFYYNIIDSLFTVRPESPVIPHYIRFYQQMLGTRNNPLII